MAELEKLSDAPAADAPSATTDVAEAAGAGDVAETAPQADAVEKTEPAKVEAEDKPDAETERRLSAVQKAEKRAKEAIAKERSEVAAEKAELAKLRAEVEQRTQSFEKLKARAKYDPAAVLAELGLTEDDFEPAARDIYARSKAAAADPKAKEAAIRMQREREAIDKLSQLEKKHAELEAKLTAKEQQAQYEQAWTGYVGDVGKLVTAESSPSPLLRAALSAAPGETHGELRQMAAAIYEDTGEWPDPADLATHYEKYHRARFARFGIEAPAAKAAPAKAAADTTTKGAPKTLGTDMAGATPIPGKKKSLKEQREETDRLLSEGKVD